MSTRNQDPMDAARAWFGKYTAQSPHAKWSDLESIIEAIRADERARIAEEQPDEAAILAAVDRIAAAADEARSESVDVESSVPTNARRQRNRLLSIEMAIKEAKTTLDSHQPKCEKCGTPVPDYEPEWCCGGRECEGMGFPIEPCLCAECGGTVPDYLGIDCIACGRRRVERDGCCEKCGRGHSYLEVAEAARKDEREKLEVKLAAEVEVLMSKLDKLENLILPMKQPGMQREASGTLEEFVERWPEQCPICSYHRYGVMHGYITTSKVQPHTCPSRGLETPEG